MLARDFETCDVILCQDGFEHGGVRQGHAPRHRVATTTKPTEIQLGGLRRTR